MRWEFWQHPSQPHRDKLAERVQSSSSSSSRQTMPLLNLTSCPELNKGNAPVRKRRSRRRKRRRSQREERLLQIPAQVSSFMGRRPESWKGKGGLIMAELHMSPKPPSRLCLPKQTRWFLGQVWPPRWKQEKTLKAMETQKQESLVLVSERSLPSVCWAGSLALFRVHIFFL